MPVCVLNNVDTKINKARFLTVGQTGKRVTNLILFNLSQIYCFNEHSRLVFHSPSPHLFLLAPVFLPRHPISLLLLSYPRHWRNCGLFFLVCYPTLNSPIPSYISELESRAGTLQGNKLTNA